MKKGFLVTYIKSISTVIILCIFSWFVLKILSRQSFIDKIVEFIESRIYNDIIFTFTAIPSEHLLIIDQEDKNCDRATYAKLISVLDSSGAKVIALDVLFEGEKDPLEDSMLVNATRSLSYKVIHAFEFINRDYHKIIPNRFGIKLLEKSSSKNIIKNINGVILPFKDLLDVTFFLGHVTSASITTSEINYFPLIVNFNNRLYPSLPLLTVMNFLNFPYESLNLTHDEYIELKNNSSIIKIPVDRKYKTLINFIAKDKFSISRKNKYSIDEMWYNIKEDPTLFEKKIILIGNTCDTNDKIVVPRDTSYPSLMLIASLISQLLNNENIREGIWESFFASFALAILGNIFQFILPQRLRKFKVLSVKIVSFVIILFFSFFILLFFAMIAFNYGIKISIILPYSAFCITIAVSFIIIKPKKVFISYSQKDENFVMKLNKYLEKKSINTIIDKKFLKSGNIEEFYNRSIRDADFTIFVVSENSLKSLWVYREILLSLMYETVQNKEKLIPVSIDKKFLDEGFELEIRDWIKKRLDELVSEINKKSQKQLPTNELSSEKDQLIEINNNLDKILKKLRDILVIDFSSDEEFDENLHNLINKIKNKN